MPGLQIRTAQGDIAQFEGDAIVNAANNRLKLGAGVAGAIARRGGPSIQRECDEHGPIRVGEAAITGAGKLAARFVIHAAAMGDEPASEATIQGSTRASLELSDSNDITTVAFPILASGIAGFPLAEATEIMIRTILDYAAETETTIESVTLYGYSADDEATIRGVLESVQRDR